ncbi:hypothetical protein A3A46_04330 [Candidatus Roizmanbacteria bacterium RIFCSPLOWO2_01_FULL_37_13]|uniref:Uncharacterized protein n=1 Tax=Candidatus Roizmanbacteria bacterium RIFCSPHIGHO2_02_FULL_38_11 TaxID=1802039 RepID=A0A1F7H0U3_9BACT|nr:MAG: hypothetical protein A3C25_03105 [Candidatus Roizmanbacteria bacterium RIFCSPHIGHO2_02_FULL_38_11]OGK41002.1 MAG: hypothetical protein A3A46_04330 [Candidatus Roizmanbacteria bacterium RIFCSPLOWO2_01_FULL_37_13]
MPINPTEAGLDPLYKDTLVETGRKTFSLDFLNVVLNTISIATKNYNAQIRPVDPLECGELLLVPRSARFTLPQSLALLALADGTDSTVICGLDHERRRVNQWQGQKIVATTRARTRVIVEEPVDLSENRDGSAIGIDTYHYAVSGMGLIFLAAIQH